MHTPRKAAPEGYWRLLPHAWKAIGFPDRTPVLIGVDGRACAGKTSLSAWLAWQLGMPSFHLDYYWGEGRQPRTWSPDLKRVIDLRLEYGRPVIVEGLFLLQALRAAGREPDLLVFVECQGPEAATNLAEEVESYIADERPHERAHFHLTWSLSQTEEE